jgi:aquaporin Z
LYVIIGTTSKGAAIRFAGIPIGLCLTLIHLFAGGAYIAQLWLFWLAPILGAAVAGAIARWQHHEPDSL